MHAPAPHLAPSVPDITGNVSTPALVWDMDVLDDRLAALEKFAEKHGCILNYSIKAASVAPVIDRIGRRVSGIACSSPFEARLARRVLGNRGSVHITSPALRAEDCRELRDTCDRVSFNSLSQLENLQPLLAGGTEFGLRINPQVSIVADPRVDPCREHSKLGIALSDLRKEIKQRPELMDHISGFHIHTGCGNRSFSGLKKSVARIAAALPAAMERIEWFNLGGGYYFDKIFKDSPFEATVERLRDNHGLEVVIEPGAAVVRSAARLLTTVVDLHRSENMTIAVLDTTVNHLPEAYIYGFSPLIKDAVCIVDNATEIPENTYLLAGASCLAGDVFGVYAFKAPLEIGSRLTIEKMGAYTHSQWHWYNGINLPTIYTESKAHGLLVAKTFSFPDFARHCAAQ